MDGNCDPAPLMVLENASPVWVAVHGCTAPAPSFVTACARTPAGMHTTRTYDPAAAAALPHAGQKRITCPS